MLIIEQQVCEEAWKKSQLLVLEYKWSLNFLESVTSVLNYTVVVSV